MTHSARWTAADVARAKQRTAPGATIAEPRYPTFYIGIDPGVSTGYAVYQRKRGEAGTIRELRTVTFAWVLKELPARYIPSTTRVVIEDPGQNKPMFDKDIPQTIEHLLPLLKIAQNVGANKREAELLIELIEALGFEVIRIRPTAHKWTEKEFKQFTGYAGRCSQHARDAARLVWGR